MQDAELRCCPLDHLFPFIIIHNLSLMERTWLEQKLKGIFELKFSQSCGGGWNITNRWTSLWLQTDFIQYVWQHFDFGLALICLSLAEGRVGVSCYLYPLCERAKSYFNDKYSQVGRPPCQWSCVWRHEGWMEVAWLSHRGLFCCPPSQRLPTCWVLPWWSGLRVKCHQY